jgi:hypothetical protein
MGAIEGYVGFASAAMAGAPAESASPHATPVVQFFIAAPCFILHQWVNYLGYVAGCQADAQGATPDKTPISRVIGTGTR